jgi:hypothetical protein
MPPISTIKKRSGVASAINRYGRDALNTLKAHSAHVYRGIRGVESLGRPQCATQCLLPECRLRGAILPRHYAVDEH